MTRPDPTAFVWRGDLATGTATTARLVAYPSRVGRLRLRIRLRRATVDAIRDASTRATFRREWYGTWRDPQGGAEWPESRTRLHDLASWLRGAR